MSSSNSSSSSDSDIALLELLTDWESDEDAVCKTTNTRTYKKRIDYMYHYDDQEFTYRFRLNKTAVDDLLTEIYPFLSVTSRRNHGISPVHQLLLTLRFYALGTMLVTVADFIGVSKTSASRIIKDVSQAIAKLYPKYIYVRDNTQKDFYKIAGFPRVLGAIDATQILIQSPYSNMGKELKNSKSISSLNVQGVCDANLKFLNLVAEWPGSTHDAIVFDNSELRVQCENGTYGNRWLLGDNAYPCRSYLLTPLVNTVTENEINYNQAHINTRNTIERCFDVWKRRFPVLCLKMRISLENTKSVIVATAVLHNVCRQRNLDDVEPEIEIPNYDSEIENYRSQDFPNQAHQISERESLINDYFI